MRGGAGRVKRPPGDRGGARRRGGGTAGVGLLVVLYLLCLPLFETRGDRERILRTLDVPADFEFLAVESGGNRVGLGSDGPRSHAHFSASWDDGGLCMVRDGVGEAHAAEAKGRECVVLGVSDILPG